MDIKNMQGDVLVSGVITREDYLCYANLRNANLSEANLRCANLRNADLSEADLRDADLRNADLSGANLREADLSGADLRDAYLRDANLSGANLRNADLSGTNLSGAYLRDANLSGAVGLLDPIEWMGQLDHDVLGVITYKRIGLTEYLAPSHWVIEPGSVLTEVVNPDRCTECGCGVNFGTLEWAQAHYRAATLWRCRIAWMDLAGVVVPYNTDGKARCSRLTLLEPLE